LLLPGVIPALAALAPWMDSATTAGRRTVYALGLAGFLVSAPCLVVPHGAQLAGEGPESGETVGLSVVEQYRLIPSIVNATASAWFTPFQGREDLDRHASLWQVAATKELGVMGLMMAVLASVALAGVTGVAGVKLYAAVGSGA
jgi:hypothetical protein